MRRAIAAVMTGFLLACSPSADQADTLTLGSIDTVKAATDSLAVTSDAGATTAAGATPGGVTQNKSGTASQSTKSGTKTGTKTAADTGNLGRDRAIPIDTKNPRNRLPTVDTTKRPPSET
jgi:hypothetical protein